MNFKKGDEIMQNSKFRYWIIGMILAIMTINYIDRGALAYAQQDIIAEFGLNPAQWGSIQGFFGYGYIFGGLFGGVLADKKGPRFVWITFVTLWSIAVALTAYAGDIGIAVFGGSAMAGFFVIRALFGFSEGPSFCNDGTFTGKLGSTYRTNIYIVYYVNWYSFRFSYNCTCRCIFNFGI